MPNQTPNLINICDKFVTIFDYYVDALTFYPEKTQVCSIDILRSEKSLEPEVHIVERYMQLTKKCFTMTNIALEGGKEIDLLALNPLSGEKYHIEVRVAIGKGFRLRLIDTQTKEGHKHRRGLDTLNEIKFTHPIVTRKIEQIFRTSEYKKILVVWDVENAEVVREAKVIYDIEVWKIPDILDQIMKKVETKPHRDDILRTLQLVFLGWKTDRK